VRPATIGTSGFFTGGSARQDACEAELGALLDIVFSLDSVITAVGMVKEVGVMIAAIVIALALMLFAAATISDFVHRHPTLKMLGLSFLLLIGFTLIAEGLGQHIPKGYVYFAMGFSAFVESLNLRLVRKAAPVHLHDAMTK
jgi:predicted tellurium resistance membrane protein TerC